MPTPSVTMSATLQGLVKNENFSRENPPNSVVFEVDNGPPKVRKRGTFQREIYHCPIQLNGTNLADWDSFIDAINGGTDPFYFTDPITRVQAVWRIRNGNIPTFKNETPGATTKKTYTASLMMERITYA